MPSIDMPLEQLRQYKPALYREADFERFWDQTVSEAIRQPIHAELIPYPLGAKNVECFAVRFDGFAGGRIAGFTVILFSMVIVNLVLTRFHVFV